MDILCLGIWIYYVIYGVYCLIKDKEVSKIAFIGSTLVCTMYYIERITH